MKLIIKLISAYKKYIFHRRFNIDKSVNIGFKAKCVAERQHQINIMKNSHIHCAMTCSVNGSISVGSYCSIRYNTVIESESSILIGNYVIISNNVIICDNNSHPTSAQKRKVMLESGEYGLLWAWSNSDSSPIIIEDHVWIGRNTIILKGVTVGEGSIVASGTVVTKSIKPYSLCYGNPCIVKEGKYLNEKT